MNKTNVPSLPDTEAGVPAVTTGCSTSYSLASGDVAFCHPMNDQKCSSPAHAEFNRAGDSVSNHQH